ncbi:acyltransferase [Vibrio splendidus]
MIRLLMVIFAVIKTIIYRFLYFNQFNIHVSSFFNGLVLIKCGQLVAGKKVRARTGCIINVNEGKLLIGDNVFFNNDLSVNCRDSISIGSNCMFGESVKLYDHDHEIDLKSKVACHNKYVTSPINIGDNVWVGSNVIILKGVKIGSGSIISAGSIVSKDIPKNSTLIQKRLSTLIDN